MNEAGRSSGRGRNSGARGSAGKQSAGKLGGGKGGSKSGSKSGIKGGSKGSGQAVSRGRANPTGRATTSRAGAQRAAGGAARSAAGRSRGSSDRPEFGPGSRRATEVQGLGGDQVEGRQAVRELLSAKRRAVLSVTMAEGMDAAAILDEIESLATARRVRVDHVSRRRIDSMARTETSQGVVALARPIEETPLEALCEPSRRGRVPFLLVLDGITDPHNLGALLRSAECAGVTGVVLPRHRSAHLSPTVAKVAAGAIEYLPMALVAGVPSALQRLSGMGVWTVGLVGEAPQPLYELPLGDQPVALVLGSEGTGLAALTRKRCDALASIPQHGFLSSLNVSTAGAIACFDVARQRAK